jgi:hypothetical protein
MRISGRACYYYLKRLHMHKQQAAPSSSTPTLAQTAGAEFTIRIFFKRILLLALTTAKFYVFVFYRD